MAQKTPKLVYTITQMVELGYPRKAVEMACHGQYAKDFAQRTSKRGRWYITLKPFQEHWNNGDLLKY